jgi:hypothetical protein
VTLFNFISTPASWLAKVFALPMLVEQGVNLADFEQCFGGF